MPSQFTHEETALMADQQFFRTKAQIMAKVRHMLSATHEALAAIRVMTISMAVGQAAGTAAAMAGAGDGAVRAVDVAALRATLLRDGACLS